MFPRSRYTTTTVTRDDVGRRTAVNCEQQLTGTKDGPLRNADIESDGG